MRLPREQPETVGQPLRYGPLPAWHFQIAKSGLAVNGGQQGADPRRSDIIDGRQLDARYPPLELERLVKLVERTLNSNRRPHAHGSNQSVVVSLRTGRSFSACDPKQAYGSGGAANPRWLLLADSVADGLAQQA